MFYVYIIYSASHDCYYKGATYNVNKSVGEHNDGMSRFKKDKIPWEFVYSKKYNSKQEALIDERRIKKINRNSLSKLINDQVD